MRLRTPEGGADSWELRPLNTLVNETYTAYFNVSLSASAADEQLCVGDTHNHAAPPIDDDGHHLTDPASSSNGSLERGT